MDGQEERLVVREVWVHVFLFASPGPWGVGIRHSAAGGKIQIFLIDTLNRQTDCTTSGHEQNRRAAKHSHKGTCETLSPLFSSGINFYCSVYFSS
jgi:hypothetical protein